MTVAVELTESVPEHIVTSDDERSLCGADCHEADARCVPDDRDPVGDASVHLCPACADEWARIANETERAPTVQCRAVRLLDGDAERWWECGDVAPTTDARAIRDGGVRVPVCPDCYDYLFEYPTSGVDTPIGDAPTWDDIGH